MLDIQNVTVARAGIGVHVKIATFELVFKFPGDVFFRSSTYGDHVRVSKEQILATLEVMRDNFNKIISVHSRDKFDEQTIITLPCNDFNVEIILFCPPDEIASGKFDIDEYLERFRQVLKALPS